MLISTNWRKHKGRETKDQGDYQTLENTEIIGALSVGMKRMRTM